MVLVTRYLGNDGTVFSLTPLEEALFDDFVRITAPHSDYVRWVSSSEHTDSLCLRVASLLLEKIDSFRILRVPMRQVPGRFVSDDWFEESGFVDGMNLEEELNRLFPPSEPGEFDVGRAGIERLGDELRGKLLGLAQFLKTCDGCSVERK